MGDCWLVCRVPHIVQVPDQRGEIDGNLLTIGKAAIAFAHSNQLVGYQALNKSKLGLSTTPNGGAGAKPGQYLKPSMLWSVSAQSKQQEALANVVLEVSDTPLVVVML